MSDDTQSVQQRLDAGATSIDVAAVEALRDTVLPAGTKGIPLDAIDLTVGELANSRWNVLRDGLPMPLMILKEPAIATNVEAMAAYCRYHGVSLAPHGKTTMAPQLFRRQIEAGAWAMTAATPAHLRVYRHFGVGRVIYGNELVEDAVIRWLAGELQRAPGFELYCLVDSVESVSVLDRGLAAHGAPRPIGVLVEVGYHGGRSGVRDLPAARDVAAAVDAAPLLELAGVECFEGLLGDGRNTEHVDSLLASMRHIAVDLSHGSSLREREEMLISAGGSAYFDRVVDTFVTRWDGPREANLVLRSGCYVTQDGGYYHEASPLAGRRDGSPLLDDAIEIWSAVLSRPEPGRAICSIGRRDAPHDMGMPIITKAVMQGSEPTDVAGVSVAALNDQHGQLELDPACQLSPGDLVGCAISHPCTAFDKWRVIAMVDDDYIICDAVVTCF